MSFDSGIDGRKPVWSPLCGIFGMVFAFVSGGTTGDIWFAEEVFAATAPAGSEVLAGSVEMGSLGGLGVRGVCLIEI